MRYRQIHHLVRYNNFGQFPTSSVKPGQQVGMSKNIDETQAIYLQEECILVDDNDKMIGSASKKACHRWDAISKGECLHRAFSVFIFNRKRQLLLQQRSPQKITFPGLWTNTCCSHPLNTQTEVDGVVGVKTAAIRKLQHELGIPTNTFRPDDLRFLTRIQYRAQADNEWAEHEIDYILIAKSESEVPLDQVNRNEVMDTRYVDEDELRQMIAQHTADKPIFTPWFMLIVEKGLLSSWWNHLEALDSVADQNTIHKY